MIARALVASALVLTTGATTLHAQQALEEVTMAVPAVGFVRP